MKTYLSKGLPSSLSKALFFSVFQAHWLAAKVYITSVWSYLPSLSVVAESENIILMATSKITESSETLEQSSRKIPV